MIPFDKIASLIQSAFNQVQAVEVQAFIFELQNQIFDLKKEVIDMKEKCLKLEEDNNMYKAQTNEYLNWDKEKNKYELVELRESCCVYALIGSPISAKFCPNCFNSRKIRHISPIHNNLLVLNCPDCNGKYYTQ